MKKYIVMGNYTAKAFQGFMKDPKQDRSIAVKALTEAVGGTFESFSSSQDEAGAFESSAILSVVGIFCWNRSAFIHRLSVSFCCWSMGTTKPFRS